MHDEQWLEDMWHILMGLTEEGKIHEDERHLLWSSLSSPLIVKEDNQCH